MSHSACKPVRASVLGQSIDAAADIQRIGDLVRDQSPDLLQVDHTLSGIDTALRDLLGKRLSEPVYRSIGVPPLLRWGRSARPRPSRRHRARRATRTPLCGGSRRRR
jgi:L-alanine-DL-glutamate epimerase-like enolase superfamily enzyme